ncbi:MAG: GntR family transcriptional regulator [Vicinamibacteria bacterium]
MTSSRSLRKEKRAAPKALLRSAPGSLYLQLATLLRQMIQSGQFAAGGKLPSIQSLAREYGVAQVTVCQALAMLENERLVQRHQGKGTFVSRDIDQRRLWLRLESNWDSLIRIWEGSQPRSLRVMDTIGSPPLEPSDGKPASAYRYMRRVHVHEGTPYALIDLYLDRSLYVQAPERFDTHMVIPLLETLPGVEIKFARQTLTIATADLDTAHLLEIPVNAPVGVVRRVLQDRHGVVIYLGTAIYRGDMVRLERALTK